MRDKTIGEQQGRCRQDHHELLHFRPHQQHCQSTGQPQHSLGRVLRLVVSCHRCLLSYNANPCTLLRLDIHLLAPAWLNRPLGGQCHCGRCLLLPCCRGLLLAAALPMPAAVHITGGKEIAVREKATMHCTHYKWRKPRGGACRKETGATHKEGAV